MNQFVRELLVDLTWNLGVMTGERVSTIADAIRLNPNDSIAQLEALADVIRGIPLGLQREQRRDLRLDWIQERIRDLRNAPNDRIIRPVPRGWPPNRSLPRV